MNVSADVRFPPLLLSFPTPPAEMLPVRRAALHSRAGHHAKAAAHTTGSKPSTCSVVEGVALTVPLCARSDLRTVLPNATGTVRRHPILHLRVQCRVVESFSRTE
jgi:hypothetical protein